MKRYVFVFLFICLIITLLPAASEAQFLTNIDMGGSVRYQQFHTEIYKEHFLPRPLINVSFQTPFHAGVVQAHAGYVRNEALTNSVREFDNLYATVFWLGRLPLTDNTTFLAGAGTGAERYYMDMGLSNTVETEILIAARVELQHLIRNFVFFADAGVTKVFVYHRMVFWNAGFGLRYRLRLSDKARNVIN